MAIDAFRMVAFGTLIWWTYAAAPAIMFYAVANAAVSAANPRPSSGGEGV